MGNKGLWLACALGLVLAGPAEAGEQAESWVMRALLKVSVDETGHPVEVESVRALPDAIRQYVESRGRDLRFQPVLVAGRPSPGITYVLMGVCAVERDGDLLLAAEHKGNGPGYADGEGVPPPRYPQAAIRQGQTASMVATYMVEVDGSTTLEGIEYAKPLRGGKKTFDAAVSDWVADMRYLPEQVDGRAVRTRVRMPVEFSLEGNTKRERKAAEDRYVQSRECMAAAGRQSDERLATTESSFVLLPDPG